MENFSKKLLPLSLNDLGHLVISVSIGKAIKLLERFSFFEILVFLREAFKFLIGGFIILETIYFLDFTFNIDDISCEGARAMEV